MGILTVILYALVVVTGLLLIGLILIQPSKGGGMGSAFGGVGESVLGAHAGSHLTKATVWLTAIFFVVSLVLATLIGHGYRGKDELSSISKGIAKAEAKPVKAEAKSVKAEAKPVKAEAKPVKAEAKPVKAEAKKAGK